MTDPEPGRQGELPLGGFDWPAEPIITGRCLLREVRPIDVEFLTALRTNREVRAFLGGPVDPETALSRAESEVGQPAVFLVESLSSGEPLGLVDIADHDHGGLEISYAFSAEVWGQGLAGESVRAVVDWFNETGLPGPLLAVTQVANMPSRRLLERVGANEVGEIEQFGQRQNVYIFGNSDPATRKY